MIKGPSKEQVSTFWRRYFEYHGDPVKEQKKGRVSASKYYINRRFCHHCGHQLRRENE